ncbi:unnamed protein product [Cochlearia groenlandica]
MGRPDVELDQRVEQIWMSGPRNNVISTPSLDLFTLFDETSETIPMDPKTMAAVRADASLINLRDEGRTCLSFGASIGYYERVCYLLEKDLDKVYVSDEDGLFPIHMAAKYGHVQIIEEILKRCPEALELLDRDGQNILHVAAKHGKLQVVKSILRIVDLEISNYNGFTALDVAEENIDSSYVFHQRLTWMALINAGAPRATMTFTAGFTLPGGYNNSVPNLGMATLAKKTAFQVFIVCDTLAMYSSIITIVSLIWAQLGDLSLILKAFSIALPSLALSLTSMLIAFMAGTYAVVTHLPLLGYIILAIGVIFLLALLLLLVPYVSPFVRHIFYYPYFLKLLVAGDNNNHVDVSMYTASDQ